MRHHGGAHHCRHFFLRGISRLTRYRTTVIASDVADVGAVGTAPRERSITVPQQRFWDGISYVIDAEPTLTALVRRFDIIIKSKVKIYIGKPILQRNQA